MNLAEALRVAARGSALPVSYRGIGSANPDFSSYFAPELAVRSKRQITKGIGNEEAVEWKTVCVAPDQSVCSACFAKRANAARDQRSILARTALSLRFCLVAAR